MEIVVTTLAEWGAIFTDVAVWRPVVEEICRRHGFACDTIRAGHPGSNAVFEVEGAFVKIAAPFWRDDFEREQAVYELLAAQTSLPTPRVLARGVVTAGGEWPYFVMTKLPGERIGALWDAIAPENRVAIAAELGRLTRAIHETAVPNSPFLPSSADAWSQFLRQQIDRCVAHHERCSLPPHLLAQLPDCLSPRPLGSSSHPAPRTSGGAGALPIGPVAGVGALGAGPAAWQGSRSGIDLFPEPGFRPRLLHCDIHEDHVLLSRREGRWEITGLIDFGDAQMGEPEYEWVAVGLGAFGGDRAAMRACLDAYGGVRCDREFPRRMLAWTLVHRFTDIRPHLERLGGPERVRTLEELAAGLWTV